MIHSPSHLRDVLEEIAAWPLAKRREYIAEMAKAFGEPAAEQLKDGLTEFWKRKE